MLLLLQLIKVDNKETILPTKGFAAATALHVAAGYGYPDVVRLLLRKGAKASQANMYGGHPLHSASKWGHQEVVELLLADASVDMNSREESSGIT